MLNFLLTLPPCRWNFPAAMVTRKLGPALAAGCTVVIKSAGETPFTANALAMLGERAGIPKGVINIVTALENTPRIGAELCASNIVRKISFTGSTRVGKLLMRQSSDTLKKMSLELGGNAPFIVFEDADLDIAVNAAIGSKFKSSGQTCVCSNRIMVHSSIYNEFMRRFKEIAQTFILGHGSDDRTTHGPLISTAAVARAYDLVVDSVQKGAKVEMGGRKRPDLGKSGLKLQTHSMVED
jgi:succinate-semialdehyde dehydrogenase/glutarate-semialdehyde dehydrogenase